MNELSSVKKKRKSYKFGRRRSRSLVGAITNEICSIIDKSLPQNERLKLLTRHSLDNALTIAERECCEQTDNKSFKIPCSEQVEKIDSVLESLNIYSICTSDAELASTSISLNEKCSYFSKAIAQLEKESVQWNALKTNYRNDLDREKDISEIPLKGSFNYQDYESLNYSELHKDILAICFEKNLQIEKLKKLRRKFQSCMIMANKYLSSVNQEIESYFLGSIQETPRTLIRQCIAHELDA